jgi:hypothetical protein
MAPNLNSEDYYQILGIPRSASDAELKKAYKKLAVKVSDLVGEIIIKAKSWCPIYPLRTLKKLYLIKLIVLTYHYYLPPFFI